MSDATFTRTSKSRFGLSRWNLDSYSTIPEEISKALGRSESLYLYELTQELTQRFDVSPSSVVAYANTWPFEVKNGVVTRSTDSTITASREASEEAGLWRCGTRLVWATQINKDHMRGSGTAVPKTLCKELQLTNDKILELSTPIATIVKLALTGIHWAIGSVRQLVEEQRLEIGDWCFFVFDASSFSLMKTSCDSVERFEHLLREFFPDLELSSLGQLEATLKSITFLPAHYSMASVFSALKSRGDIELVAFLSGIFPQNLAHEIRDNHSNSARFIIKSVD